MPRDASGNYTLPSGNPVVVGTTIDASWGNGLGNDLVTVLTDSLSRSGDGGMLVAFKNASGLVSAPGITWVSEPTSGFYLNTTNDMRVCIAGSDRMRFRADADQPVQIWSGGAWVDALGTDVQKIVKTSDQTVNNSNTLADDSELVGFVLTTGARYRFEVYLRVTAANDNTDFVGNLQFTNTPVTGVKLNEYFNTAVAATFAATAANIQGGQFSNIDSPATVANIVRITGTFQANASTGGTLDFQWAQNAAFAFDTIVKAGSYMTVELM